jgi:UDP-N-acetylmuramoyl-tripeptide--D-alanyl-D-alanine ligase
MQLTLAEIAQILGCPPPPVAGLALGYSIDSRTIRLGEVFFAIRGERFDGHEFVLGALGGGALAAVVERGAYERFAEHFRVRLLPVDDPIAALQTLATIVRRRWGRKVVGVTGSAGKTTTKEMIAAVLGARYRVLKTEGNLNNHFGLPLTLLRLTPAHDVAVVEMGMNHAGEITGLARIAAPQVGVVTNVNPVHLEFFSSLDEIAAAKRELIQSLPANGVAVLNADDPRVRRFGEGFAGSTVFFGRTAGAADLPHDFALSVGDVELLGGEGSRFEAGCSGCEPADRAPIRLPLLGEHNVLNAAAALATGLVFGVNLKSGAAALARMAPTGSRGRVQRLGEITLIDDSYNSNPRAFEHMLGVLASMPGRRHIVVAGEMLELGDDGPRLHREAGAAIAASGADVLLAVRGNAREIVAGALAAGFRGSAEFFATSEEAGSRLAALLQPGDVVLVKGSRGVALERALAAVRPRSDVAAETH